MSRTAYVFLFVVIALALLLHACDEASDRTVIHEAAGIALYDGVLEACDERNFLRDRMSDTAISLHPETRRDELRASLGYRDCDAMALEAIKDFRRRLRNKADTKEILNELTKLP